MPYKTKIVLLLMIHNCFTNLIETNQDEKVQKKYTIRTLKMAVEKEIISSDFQTEQELLKKFPAEQLITPLISFFCSTNPFLKWRSISVFAFVVSFIAEENMEKARILVRRLMWTLNEESGGVGWGAPEAMGELMSRNKKVANEYHKILFSYIDDHGNFLDYEPLQQGVLWGIFRLSKKRPELVKKALHLTNQYYTSKNPVNRCLALQISGITNDYLSEIDIGKLTNDESEVEIYDDGVFKKILISSLANDVLMQINKAK